MYEKVVEKQNSQKKMRQSEDHYGKLIIITKRQPLYFYIITES